LNSELNQEPVYKKSYGFEEINKLQLNNNYASNNERVFSPLEKDKLPSVSPSVIDNKPNFAINNEFNKVNIQESNKTGYFSKPTFMQEMEADISMHSKKSKIDDNVKKIFTIF